MSKRVLEFNVGDPKTNQQTASKVDSAIHITNINRIEPPAPVPREKRSTSPKRPMKSEEIKDDVQVFNDDDDESVEDIESAKPEPKESTRSVAPKDKTIKDLQVKVAVNRDTSAPVAPTNSERFVVTARNLPVLREEILASMVVKDTLLKIFIDMLTHDDINLLANIMDRSGKIILKAADFNKLLAAILSSNGRQVKPSDIKLRYNEEIVHKWCKVIVSPCKHLVSVSVGDQDLRLHQYEAYNTLTDDFNISADMVYIDPMMGVSA